MFDPIDAVAAIVGGFSCAAVGWWGMYAVTCTFRAFRISGGLE